MVYIVKFFDSSDCEWWFSAREFDTKDEAIEYAKEKLDTDCFYSGYQIYKAGQV